MLPEWDDLSSHHRFETSGADFAAMGALMGPLLASPPQMHHVVFNPPLYYIFDSPSSCVTEIVTFHSPSSTFEADIKEFLEALANADGLKGCCRGVVVEENLYSYQIFIQWESIKAHEEAMLRDDVKSKVHLVAGGAERMEMHHTKFQAA